MGQLRNGAAIAGVAEVCSEAVLIPTRPEKVVRLRRETLSQRTTRLDSDLQEAVAGIGSPREPGDRFSFRSNWRAEIPGLLALPDLRREIPDSDRVIGSGFWEGKTRRHIREYYAAKGHSPWKLAAHCLCRGCGRPRRPSRVTGLGPCGLTSEEMELLRPYWNPGHLAGKRCSHAKKV